MQILIENEQDKVEISDAIDNLIKKASELSLALEGFTLPVEISYLYVDNDRIKDMNKEFRDVDKATDVLSFPMLDIEEGKLSSSEGDYDYEEECIMLGDIVISLEMTKKQAEEYGHSFERELAFLATHGMFHLLGYDHEEPSEEKRMMEKQEAVLEQMGLSVK